MISRKVAKTRRRFNWTKISSLAPLRLFASFLFVISLVASSAAIAQEDAKPDTNPPSATETKPENSAGNDQLAIDQARLADRFKRLEEVVGRLAELSASNDPRRAKLLREAIAQSREQDLNVRFESVVKLLQDERLAAASTNQTELQKELDGLLSLLLKADREKELNSERERIKQYLKEVSRLIREQKSVRARTVGDDDLKALGNDQQRLSADTAKLGGNIEKTESDKNGGAEKNGKPSDSKPDKGESQKPAGEKPGNEKSGDKKSEDRESDDKQPGKNSKPNGPQSGKPSEDSPKDGKSQPSDGKPSEGQSGKPSDSKSAPSPGQPGSPSGGEPGEQQEQQGDQQPQPPQAPADRATNRLKKAQQQMQEAEKKLKEAQRKGATENQQQAIKELEQARAELERVLRQLREEELERTLTQLAARLRKMLEMQTAIYDGTVKVDRTPAEQRTHDHEIESARLSREELQIVHEVDKALSLLHEEGSSVAFPEAVDQMRDDMLQVAERLSVVKVDQLTQGIEKDIIAALEETIMALDKSIKDLEKKRTPPGQMPSAGGQPGDMPLVDKIAELKMIRSLQMRINTRTQRYGEMIKGEQAETPELLKSLRDLADRQQRVYKATADLQQKRND
jgi:hypothetical protein